MTQPLFRRYLVWDMTRDDETKPSSRSWFHWYLFLRFLTRPIDSTTATTITKNQISGPEWSIGSSGSIDSHSSRTANEIFTPSHPTSFLSSFIRKGRIEGEWIYCGISPTAFSQSSIHILNSAIASRFYVEFIREIEKENAIFSFYILGFLTIVHFLSLNE